MCGGGDGGGGGGGSQPGTGIDNDGNVSNANDGATGIGANAADGTPDSAAQDAVQDVVDHNNELGASDADPVIDPLAEPEDTAESRAAAHTAALARRRAQLKLNSDTRVVSARRHGKSSLKVI